MRLEVNGIEIDVHVEGPEDAPVMVVHHGGPGVSSAAAIDGGWSPLASLVRLVTFDARGSGRSPTVPPYSHEQWTADVDAIRQHLGVDRIIMAGHSYGGFVSLEYVLGYPDHVTALILEDTAARSGFDAAMDKALTSPRVSLDRPRLERVMSGRCYDDDDLRDTFAAMLPLYGDEPMSPEQVASVIGRVDFHAETHNWAFSKNQPAYNVLGRLGEIHCPTLINVGRSDWITPVEAAEELARGIASSELVIYDHSGHSPHLDEADRFTEVVSQFLVAHALTKTMTT